MLMNHVHYAKYMVESAKSDSSSRAGHISITYLKSITVWIISVRIVMAIWRISLP